MVDGGDDGVGEVKGQESTSTDGNESRLILGLFPVGGDLVSELGGGGADGVGNVLAGLLDLILTESADNVDATDGTCRI